MNWLILLLFLPPLAWCFATLTDKFILSHKVKSALAYAPVSGIVTLALGLILSLILSWPSLSSVDIMLLFAIGLLEGVFSYLFLLTLQHEDASHLIGYIYLYPVAVAILSFVILHETLPWFGYVGIAAAMFGVFLLARRSVTKNVHGHRWMLVAIVLVLGVWGVLVKRVTASVPELNAVAFTLVVEGIVLLLILFRRDVRIAFLKELHTIGWTALSELVNQVGFIISFFAYALFPASIVSAISATQLIFTLFFERIIHRIKGKMMKDKQFAPKAKAILLIVIGAVLLALAGI